MTDEKAFLDAIALAPDDWNLRLVFADWLEEQGDPRALAYRWSGAHKKRPQERTMYRETHIDRRFGRRRTVPKKFSWAWYLGFRITNTPHELPLAIFWSIAGNNNYRYFESELQAMIALANALKSIGDLVKC